MNLSAFDSCSNDSNTVQKVGAHQIVEDLLQSVRVAVSDCGHVTGEIELNFHSWPRQRTAQRVRVSISRKVSRHTDSKRGKQHECSDNKRLVPSSENDFFAEAAQVESDALQLSKKNKRVKTQKTSDLTSMPAASSRESSSTSFT